MHGAVIGTTESGKGLYVRDLILEMRKLGIRSIGYSCKPEQYLIDNADFFTTDEADFEYAFKKNLRCLVVIDEIGWTVTQNPSPFMLFTGTQGRHPLPEGGGLHSVVYVGTRCQVVTPTIRDCWQWVVAFQQDRTSSELLAQQFIDDRLLNAPQLRQFEYLRLRKFKNLEKGKVKI